MVLERLKKRWGVTSGLQIVAIFLVFSLAGMSILWFRPPVYRLLRIDPDVSLWIKIPVCVLVYQVFLLVWGTVLGQFRFFWEKEKRMVTAITNLFIRRS